MKGQTPIKCEKAAIPVTSALSLGIIASGSNTGTIISRYLAQSTNNMKTVHTIVRCLLFTELHDRSKKRREGNTLSTRISLVCRKQTVRHVIYRRKKKTRDDVGRY